ncbi:MAG TPA: aldo/keto reductase, partial [Gammaproteobacteria bacterium]|nr:aldo/keto reductase [Gammaproteobacteria bacterium]
PLTTTRRDFMALASAFGISGLAPSLVAAQQTMPLRRIPSTGEMLPVIGLGSSKVVQQIAAEGPEPLAEVLRTLVAHGGSVVDTWPRDADNDAAFGRVVSEPDLRDTLFVTTKIDQVGKDAGVAQFRQTQRLYNRETLDLVQIFSLTDLDVHWPSLKEWKAAGHARYIGVTVAEAGLYEQLERFLARETPDFIQVNYSITERQSEERLLPLAQDRGLAVLINRPFMNGVYFDRLEGQPLPEWTAEFGCETWAQFSLKFILAHPAITCVLTETTKSHHMQENAAAAFGALPDAAARAKMRMFIDQV